MEELVLNGDLYRIENPFESNYFSFAIVSKDKTKAHLTCYRSLNRCNPHPHRVVMKGLDPERKYYIPELKVTAHGSALMSVGINVRFSNFDFDTKILHFNEV